MQLLLLELNEVNFGFIRRYAERGHLPVLHRLITRHGVAETVSEERYEHLEPWIQWVTAHTGRSFASHRIFRLGDIVNSDLPQIWEQLEQCGLKVGAISPMNAKHRLRDPAFFVPDPWTSTNITAPTTLKWLYRGIAQAVNDNADARISVSSMLGLLAGFLNYASPSSYPEYIRLTLGSWRGPWRRAMFLDLLLAEVFIRELRRTRPHFASLFLNAAAHIQHHYLFCSPFYSGPHRNPSWYVRPEADPVLEVYRLYDAIVGRIEAAFPEARLMLATGLHQDAHEQSTFYWRLRRHDEFLRSIGVPFATVEPRMSRDFLITCSSAEEARVAERILKSAIASDGQPLFEVDNRGTDLFVMLVYPHDISADFEFRIGERVFSGLRKDVSFVALKNGQHNGIGYFLDTGVKAGRAPERFALAELPNRVMAALGVLPSSSLVA